MTVLEVIQRSSDFLARKGVDSPRLQVEWLLAHLLQIQRLQLYLQFERTLTDSQLDALRLLVQRRGRREPLQHILGSANFHGRDFSVDHRALIPRPETEILANHAIAFLHTLKTQPVAVLDFGTGSGCLAITIALNFPNAIVHAVDLSSDALALALENAARLNATQHVTFHLGDGFQPLPPDLHFDLIVANPPYIPSADINGLAPEVRDHDPRTALDGGPDGLSFHRRLAAEALSRLKSHGKFMLELGDGQHALARDIFLTHNWIVESIEPDYTSRPRVLIAHGKPSH
jgi:release factor glutamine methyltransferase